MVIPVGGQSRQGKLGGLQMAAKKKTKKKTTKKKATKRKTKKKK
jgi:hypothetical protein